MKNDVLKWAALAAALVATASAEYELARAVGFNEWVAAAVPGALDVYTVRAMRAHRDVLAAVVAMIGVNAASHLVTAGLLPVNVPLVVAVSAIAPLVLWRVHALRVEEVATTDTLVEYAAAVEVERVPAEPETYPALPEPVPAVPEAVPEGVRLLPVFECPGELHRALRTRPELEPEDVPEPSLTDRYTAMEVGWAAEQFKDELTAGELPSIRVIKERLSVGQPKAKEFQEAFREALPKLAGQGVSS
ncbi:hypothetical protein [Streptomyces sp. NPDC001604]|uniref:hypothetical protein n=1 Tax=Streptomyces sp. NPDC001604 TaxID=3364593 RepID=UPI00369B2086